MKLFSTLCLLLCSTAFLVAEIPSRETRKPNLIFILIDDAGYDDFSYMGCKDWKIPNIDSIANVGVNFTNGYVIDNYTERCSVYFPVTRAKHFFRMTVIVDSL